MTDEELKAIRELLSDWYVRCEPLPEHLRRVPPMNVGKHYPRAVGCLVQIGVDLLAEVNRLRHLADMATCRCGKPAVRGARTRYGSRVWCDEHGPFNKTIDRVSAEAEAAEKESREMTENAMSNFVVYTAATDDPSDKRWTLTDEFGHCVSGNGGLDQLAIQMAVRALRKDNDSRYFVLTCGPYHAETPKNLLATALRPLGQ